MKLYRITLLFLLLFLLVPSVTLAQSAANKAWAPFWKKFSSAVKTKNRSAILALAIDSSRFERDAGEDSREDWADRIAGRENKCFVSILNSGFKSWNGGKILRKNGCLWFKFIDNRWYWAGTPCD